MPKDSKPNLKAGLKEFRQGLKASEGVPATRARVIGEINAYIATVDDAERVKTYAAEHGVLLDVHSTPTGVCVWEHDPANPPVREKCGKCVQCLYDRSLCTEEGCRPNRGVRYAFLAYLAVTIVGNIPLVFITSGLTQALCALGTVICAAWAGGLIIRMKYWRRWHWCTRHYAKNFGVTPMQCGGEPDPIEALVWANVGPK